MFSDEFRFVSSQRLHIWVTEIQSLNEGSVFVFLALSLFSHQFSLFCCRIGPEPTTDAFTAVMYGENEQAPIMSFNAQDESTSRILADQSNRNQLQVIPGNALAVDKSRQFRPLTKFGGAFLNRCSLFPSLWKYPSLFLVRQLWSGSSARS